MEYFILIDKEGKGRSRRGRGRGRSSGRIMRLRKGKGNSVYLKDIKKVYIIDIGIK